MASESEDEFDQKLSALEGSSASFKGAVQQRTREKRASAAASAEQGAMDLDSALSADKHKEAVATARSKAGAEVQSVRTQLSREEEAASEAARRRAAERVPDEGEAEEEGHRLSVKPRLSEGEVMERIRALLPKAEDFRDFQRICASLNKGQLEPGGFIRKCIRAFGEDEALDLLPSVLQLVPSPNRRASLSAALNDYFRQRASVDPTQILLQSEQNSAGQGDGQAKAATTVASAPAAELEVPVPFMRSGMAPYARTSGARPPQRASPTALAAEAAGEGAIPRADAAESTSGLVTGAHATAPAPAPAPAPTAAPAPAPAASDVHSGSSPALVPACDGGARTSAELWAMLPEYPTMGGILQYRIVDTVEREELSGRQYTAYVIECRWAHKATEAEIVREGASPLSVWDLEKRNTEFEMLEAELFDLRDGPIPPLPEKGLFWSRKRVIEARLRGFTDFLHGVLQNTELREAPETRAFLVLKESVDAAKAASVQRARDLRAGRLAAAADDGETSAAGATGLQEPSAQAATQPPPPPPDAEDPLSYLLGQ